MMPALPTKQRDSRQIAGITALALIVLLVAMALSATVLAGWQGDWTSNLDTVGHITLFTLWQAILSLILSLCFAIPVALALDDLQLFFGRRLVLLLFTIPLALPVIVAVLALLTLLGRNGALSQLTQISGFDWKPDIYGLSGILIAHVFFNMPLAVRMILIRFEAIPQELWKLGESLGLSAWDRFRILQWPTLLAILPGLCGLIVLLCVGSYTIILVLGGGPQATTLQVAVYQALSFDFDITRAAMLTLAQLGVTIILLWSVPNMPMIQTQRGLGFMRRYHQTTTLVRTLSVLLVSIACLFIALPLGAVALSGLRSNHEKLLVDPLLWRAVSTSIAIGLLSALLSVGAAWALSAASYSYAKHHSPFAAVFRSIPLALLAIPSLILGIGWFLVVIKTGLPLTIAPLLIVLANAMMALPFAIQFIQPKLFETFDTSDRLAQSLGLAGMTRLHIIDLPVMRPAFMTAGLFAFALSLGDLGVVTLFGTEQILTLPALIFQKMGSYRSNDAAGLALYLAILTGLMTYLAMKAERNDRV